MFIFVGLEFRTIFSLGILAETLRLEEQALGEDQQALLAEFDRRRRVRTIGTKKYM